MSARVREHATYQDLLKVPDNMVAELIAGELFASPRPRIRTAAAKSELLTVICSAFGRRSTVLDRSHVLAEPELRLGYDVLVPDIAGWRIERIGIELPDVAAMKIAPDWICEILSPSTTRLDRAKKLPIYARHGVGYAWVVDVNEQYLEVKRLENGKWTNIAIFMAGETVRAEPFEAIEIDMTYAWGAPPA